MFPTNQPGGALFEIVPILVGLGFVLTFGIIIVKAVMGVSGWNHNNQQPILRRKSRVVSRRDKVTVHRHGGMHNNNGGVHHSRTRSTTTYFVTFEELETGQRMEFKVSEREYGMVAEDDTGVLVHQGTRYHGFERDV